MKKLLISLLVAGAFSKLCAAEAEWMTDLRAALAKAKAEKKMVLLDFTGSDWCGWCIKFNQEVLSQTAVTDYAARTAIWPADQRRLSRNWRNSKGSRRRR